jgi:hypothetical protein
VGGLGRSGEPEETPTLAEEGERALGDDPEPLRATRGIGVGIDGWLQVSETSGSAAFAATTACSA